MSSFVSGPNRLARSRLPGFVEAGFLALDPEGFFLRHAKHRGDPFVVRLPSIGDVLVSGSAEGARELFSAPPDAFAPLPVNPVEPLLGAHSLLILAGERHRRERKLMSSPFYSGRMGAYGANMCDRARAEARSWRPGELVTLQTAMRRIMLDVILRAVLGVEDARRAASFRRALAAMLDSYTSPLLVLPMLRRPLLGLSPWARFARARAAACELLRDEIRSRRANAADGEDILSLLMNARYEDGSALTEDELLDEARTLIVAGHDTTTTALVWSFFYLYRDLAKLAKLKDELMPLGPEPSPAALADLPYLSAVCGEALRLHPVVPVVPRMAVKPFRFRGFDVNPGEFVAVSISLLQRDPTIYREPAEFRPERFIERKFSPFEYAPFGGGARRCIGAAFGAYQMKMVLGSIVSCAALDSEDAAPPRRLLAGITMGPGSAVRLRVRNHSSLSQTLPS